MAKHSFEDYLKLLQDFGGLPKTKISRTFMEVSGYPHYENVCSNILGFYFDPIAEHGLKDLFLNAFLRMTGREETESPINAKITREYPTHNGKRIDLLIDSELFTIGIENKIYHGLNNDLLDYAETIDRLGGDTLIVKAVLGLKHIRSTLQGGFVSYTYIQFWQHVQQMLGHYVTKAEPKWLTYLIEFIQTTTNLAGENMELTKTDQFFIEHDRVIEDLLSERRGFLNRLKQKILELENLMKKAEEKDFLSSLYRCADDRLVLDFTFEKKYKISFDVYLTPSGWDLQLFGRDVPSYRYLLKLIEVLKATMGDVNLMNGGRRYSVQKWNIPDDLGAIKGSLCLWINAVWAAAEAVREELPVATGNELVSSTPV